MRLREALLQQMLRDHLAGAEGVELEVAPRVDHPQRRLGPALDGGRAVGAPLDSVTLDSRCRGASHLPEEMVGRPVGDNCIGDLIGVLLETISRCVEPTGWCVARSLL